MLKILLLTVGILLIGYNQICEEKHKWLESAKNRGRVHEDFGLEKYQDLKEDDPNFLGKGSFGVIGKMKYKVKENGKFIDVALKVIKINYNGSLSKDQIENEKKNIQMEVKWMKMFNKEAMGYFAKFYDCFYDETNYYILSEMLDVDLGSEKFFKEFKSSSVMQKLKVMLEMAKGVEIIHNTEVKYRIKTGDASQSKYEIHNIAHNDIKPENFMLSLKAHPRVKIIDMGFFQIFGALGRDGSPLYMPPEKIYNKEYEISPANDIWSLGITFGQLMIRDKYWPNIKEEYKSAKYDDLVPKFKEHVSSFSDKYNNLYSEKNGYEAVELTALKRLELLISEEMLNLDAQKRANISKVVEDLKSVILKLYRDTLFLLKDDEKDSEFKNYHEKNKKSLDLLGIPSNIEQLNSYFIPSGKAVKPPKKPFLKLLI